MADNSENETADAEYEFSCGARLTEELLQRNTKCTAIIAVNDMTATGCISVLNQRGVRIPEEMAICSFDNLMLHRMLHPQLTSVDQMAFHGCKIGLSIVMDKINNVAQKKEPVMMEYKPRLYIRGSTVKE